MLQQSKKDSTTGNRTKAGKIQAPSTADERHFYKDAQEKVRRSS
jgi:hypothetical protein